MVDKTIDWICTSLFFLALMGSPAVAAETRTWTSRTGGTIDAELIAVQGGNVVLRKADGTQLTVAIRQLSPADRQLVEGESPRGNRPDAEFAELSAGFFTGLRSEKRDAVIELLSKKAQEIAKGEHSPLASLPAPDEGDHAIRVGRAKINDALADVPIQVRIAGRMHKTKLHLRREGEQWRIFAMSVDRPGGEQAIDFESEAGQVAHGDRLAVLIGKPFAFAGVTLDGQRLDPARYQGKVVLFDFWAASSPPSLAEQPNVLANYQKYFPKGFDVVGVSTDQDLEALARFVRKVKPPWAIVADAMAGKRNSMAAKYGIDTVPTQILVDKDGKVAAVHCAGKELGEQLDKLLSPEEKKKNNQPAAKAGDKGF